jgi:tRNA(fMet)-specific endonuclease VapC
MDLALLDTDILSEVLGSHHPTVRQHAAAYLSHHGQLAFSALTRFQALRGLREKNATSKLTKFSTLCTNSLIFPVTDPVLDCAIDLWLTARRGGFPCSDDADLLIGATAIIENLVLVTGNTSDFAWMPGIRLANWRMP